MAIQQGAPGLAQNPRMLALAYELNHLPSRYIHPTWLETVAHHEWIKRIQRLYSSNSGNTSREIALSEIALSRYLNKVLELSEWWDFQSTALRIALLDPPSLADVVWHLGLMSQAASIQKAVIHDHVVHLKKTLGEQSYLFALKRAPFLGTLPSIEDELSTNHPSYHRTIEYDDPLSIDWTMRTHELGQLYLMRLLTEGGSAVQQRALLKLPKHPVSSPDIHPNAFSNTNSHPHFNTHLDTHPLNRLVYKLIAERIPQWLPLFA